MMREYASHASNICSRNFKQPLPTDNKKLQQISQSSNQYRSLMYTHCIIAINLHTEKIKTTHRGSPQRERPAKPNVTLISFEYNYG